MHRETTKHTDEAIVNTSPDDDKPQIPEESSDQSVMYIDPNATSTECENGANVGDSNDSEKVTMSGVEELLDIISRDAHILHSVVCLYSAVPICITCITGIITITLLYTCIIMQIDIKNTYNIAYL